jgi:Membrane protease subunits, stomatin/prohibitin homologs
MENKITKEKVYEEFEIKHVAGIPMLILNIVLVLASATKIIWSIVKMEQGDTGVLPILALIVGIIILCVAVPLIFAGLKVLKPNEALVLTLFGKYVGTLKGAGYYFVNPLVSAVKPGQADSAGMHLTVADGKVSGTKANGEQVVIGGSKKISLKTLAMNSGTQKINDLMGNPINIGEVVIWRVVNTAKAVFNVDDYTEYLSIQCDSALRNIVRLYPYDTANEEENEKTLRGSSHEIAEKLKEEIQSKVDIAGLEIIEARITHLSYSTEIAAAMLQRQQASAIIDARKLIVEGAVGMVEMALSNLSENDIVHLDDERKAAMVSNLLVVLCGNKDAQPIVNSGSIY